MRLLLLAKSPAKLFDKKTKWKKKKKYWNIEDMMKRAFVLLLRGSDWVLALPARIHLTGGRTLWCGTFQVIDLFFAVDQQSSSLAAGIV